MAFIEATNVTHRFVRRDEEGQITGAVWALDGIDLSVQSGQFIAILGKNGSGKSTFARHLNALLTPTEGTLFVDGKDARDADAVWDIRRAAGMIFQNPDNQIVAGVVEEDVAFGPENLGLPTEKIRNRVADSLRTVEMSDYRRHSPNRLSGGQKQRVAVAGVIAMQPQCILMDEATAMLDPGGRAEVMETAHRLHREAGVTVLLITHFMEEAAGADYVYVLDEGKIALQGTPREVFSREEELLEHGLSMPPIGQLAGALRRDGLPIPKGILTRAQLVEALGACLRSPRAAQTIHSFRGDARAGGPGIPEETVSGTPASDRGQDEARTVGSVPAAYEETGGEAAARGELLRLKRVSYTYSPGTVYETRALKNVNFTLRQGETVGLIGPTGSGKSTLIQMLNGLLKPDAGTVTFKGRELPKGHLRGEVGLVFQFAESQLFETTVLRDVAFGPKNLGLNEKKAEKRAQEALRLVGLSEEYEEMSPFDLSGGEQRRAAIAGVLAMEPSVLVLDEPTAGLDPEGREELFSIIRRLRETRGITVLLISHNMEDIAELAERIVVLREGEVRMEGTPAEVFSHARELEEASLAVPEVTYLMADLRAKGYPADLAVTTVEQAEKAVEELC